MATTIFVRIESKMVRKLSLLEQSTFQLTGQYFLLRSSSWNQSQNLARKVLGTLSEIEPLV